jgi:6-phosphogluconate dehydrogenase
MKKQLGYIGLGKMGFGMVERLLENGFDATVFDMNKEVVGKLVEKGAHEAQDFGVLVASLEVPRLVWIMVPHQAVDAVLTDLIPHLEEGDTVIDGGNSPYLESVRRGEMLKAKGVAFLDAGVSGGPAGARNGACLMVGGERTVYEKYEELFKVISAPEAYGYMGDSGAGHFTKMVHNGIEYGMMQAIAEGFNILKTSPYNISLTEATHIYNTKSVVESRLIGWLASAYKQYGENLDAISGEVIGTGEGAWTVEAAKHLGTIAPIIEGSVNFRESTHGNPSYIGKVLAALRNQFGGHEALNK